MRRERAEADGEEEEDVQGQIHNWWRTENGGNIINVIVGKWHIKHILTTYFWLRRCKISRKGVVVPKRIA